MKLSKIGKYIYLISPQNYIFVFSASFPSMKISLGECLLNDEDRKNILLHAFDTEKDFHKKLRAYIDSDGIAIGENYYNVCHLLQDYFHMPQEKMDEMFGYNKEAVELCKNLKVFFPEGKYHNCCHLLNKWKDKERVKKYIETFDNDSGMIHTLVDIFPTEEDLARPTWKSEAWLLRKFYDSWGNVDAYIKEAVEKYPSYDDIDYAGYFVKEKLKEEQEKALKKIKERNGSKKEK